MVLTLTSIAVLRNMYIYSWAFSCKSGHGGQNFKYIRIKQIWSQMKAESLYFDDISQDTNFHFFVHKISGYVNEIYFSQK